MVRYPINPKSPRKMIQLMKLDQEKMRWKKNINVKRSADCQAWNLMISVSIAEVAC